MFKTHTILIRTDKLYIFYKVFTAIIAIFTIILAIFKISKMPLLTDETSFVITFISQCLIGVIVILQHLSSRTRIGPNVNEEEEDFKYRKYQRGPSVSQMGPSLSQIGPLVSDIK